MPTSQALSVESAFLGTGIFWCDLFFSCFSPPSLDKLAAIHFSPSACPFLVLLAPLDSLWRTFKVRWRWARGCTCVEWWSAVVPNQPGEAQHSPGSAIEQRMPQWLFLAGVLAGTPETSSKAMPAETFFEV
jgi:hypothetical protein